MSVFVIAEAGINHGGDLCAAHALVHAAYEAGADAVKFQSFTAERLGYDAELTAFLRKCQLTEEMHLALKEHANALKMEFISTPFDAEWCDFLVSLGVKRLKISSGKVRDVEFVRHVGSKMLPVIASTGMSTRTQRIAADNVFATTDVTWLYCVSKYPTPLSEIDFREMLKIPEYLCDKFGISDHSANPAVGVLAAAAGAQMVEAHLTLDRSLPGPDHVASMLPSEFKQMVDGVRNVK